MVRWGMVRQGRAGEMWRAETRRGVSRRGMAGKAWCVMGGRAGHGQARLSSI